MKNKNISHGIAELDGRKLEIDLDNLYITFERDRFDLARIPGTKGGNRYFFSVLFVVNDAENSIRDFCYMVVDHARKYTRQHWTEVRQIANTIGNLRLGKLEK